MANKYKDTLLIGTTDFSMRANLKDKEPLIEQDWVTKTIYQQKLKLNENKPLFILHDGPPYANGDLHIGHALNKSLKDFIVRWKNSFGYQAPFVMGWDTHGLPIENAVTQQGVDRKQLDPIKFRELCAQFALKQVDNQKKQFRRLGIFTDDATIYQTLDHDYEISELRSFEKMFNQGLIYRDLKPIYWSPSSESALADSEIEYYDVKTPTVYVGVDVEPNDLLPSQTQLMIWTTTPWTLPSNQAIAVGQDLEYSLVKVVDESDQEHLFVLGTDLLASLQTLMAWKKVEVLKTFKGQKLVGLKYLHPLYPQLQGEIYHGEHVTSEAGTGLVHIASGFGEDDYNLIKGAGLPIFAPIDDQGKFSVEIKALDPELVGVFYDDANKIITNRLAENHHLLKLKFLSHSYPHDWRTKKPVIYRATKQWFINLRPVKEEILAAVNKVQTQPKWAQQRLAEVLAKRDDWTISRQRLWGVPIIGFYDQNNELVLNEEILAVAIAKIEALGTNAWFKEPADVFLPAKYQNQNLRKEKDILDVWFDSGTSALALEARFSNWHRPYDLYLEGNDQYRGWFNSSMINSVIFDNKAPYQTLLSHGMTTDQNGKKMSKSLGNGIDPIAFATTNGADVLRLWVSSTDYTDDQRIGQEIINQVSETYRKIRNTLRFILGNLFDFDKKTNYQPVLTSVDRYALFKLSEFKQKAINSYENYHFNEVYQGVINYITTDLSSFYLDFIKDILYVDGQDWTRRRQVQTVLFEILWGLIDILRPLIPHTIEEVYTYLLDDEKVVSVHLLDVKEQNFVLEPKEVELWTKVLKVREEVNKALEIAREKKLINKGFEASVELNLTKDYEVIKDVEQLATIFIVSEIKFSHDLKNPTFAGKTAKIKITPRVGEKCERCWGIFDQTVDGLCDRCSKVVHQ